MSAKSFLGVRVYRNRRMFMKIILSLVVTASIAPRMTGQAVPTAARSGDLHIGASFNLTKSDYSAQLFKGFIGL